MKLKLFMKGVAASAKKNVPQLMIFGGILAGAGALVTACVQTTKLNDILDESKAEMDKRQQAVEDEKMMKDEKTGEERQYTQEDADHDKRALYFRTALRIVKLYAIPAALSALSIALILSGNKMHRVRTAEAVAMGNAAIATYNQAKERAREVLGEEKTKEIFDGVKPTGEFIDKEWVDDEGKKHKDKYEKFETELDEWGCDNRTTFLYSAETSKMHSMNHLANQMLFSCQEEDMARVLEWEGCWHVNDVLKKLGLSKTGQGQKDGRIAEEFGGTIKGLTFKATLVDAATETYVIEIPHDGDISGRDGKIYRMMSAK